MASDRRDYSYEEYYSAQDRETGWSHEHIFPSDKVHAKHFISYLHQTKRLKSDGTDSFCDFGGNDGTGAEELRKLSGGIATCYDIDHDKQYKGKRLYPGVTFVNGGMEDMKDMKDDCIDWGFTIQSLEHTRDIEAVMSEIARVCRYGCYMALPVEHCRSFKKNYAHIQHTTDWRQWVRWAEPAGFRLAEWAKSFNAIHHDEDGMVVHGPELIYIFTLPTDKYWRDYRVMGWYKDLDTTHVGTCR